MIYLVMVQYRDCLAWAEREASDTDRATTVDHIRTGNLSNVVTVLECNPVEGICRDVTEEIQAEAKQEGEPTSLSAEQLRGMLIDHDRDLKRDGLNGW